MNFGEALEIVKNGGSVRRYGWNGRGMSIYLNKGSTPQEIDAFHVSGLDYKLFEPGSAGTVTRLPNINMQTADGSTLTGWLASQTDMLAGDWIELVKLPREEEPGVPVLVEISTVIPVMGGEFEVPHETVQ